MSDIAKPATPATPDRPVEGRASASSADARFASRRRLLKAGATGVPVALTLTSRPVLAWHCNTASAWGSAQMTPNQSTTARNAANQLADNTWSITDWQNNSTGVVGTYPWVKLGTQSSTNGVTSNSKKYTIASLFSNTGGTYPTGLMGTDTVWDKIMNGSTFQKYMIVAKLNAKLIPSVATCLKSDGVDQLQYMLDGSYAPSNLKGTQTWGQGQIQTYLYENYIVR